ncbi:solute carrier family 23 protein, partial [Streptomyces angustmyceticus]|uniref:solute carrier family 23 protein n=1 Tax=Streptomyces angustmyceticus TaxID=285578 RepID=UPI00244AE973
LLEEAAQHPAQHQHDQEGQRGHADVGQRTVVRGPVVATLVPVGITHFSALSQASLIGFPTPFHFGAPQFDLAAIVSMCIVMLVCMTESTADMLALGRIVDRPA